MLTYRLLGQKRLSLYEARAVGYTVVPSTLLALCRQRVRWARGMFEGFRAVPPWRQPTFYAGYFEALNLSIVYLDLAYVFGFLPGVLLAMFGMYWFAGWATLLMLPALFLSASSVYTFQRRVRAADIQNSVWGGFLFLFVFQTLQSFCSLAGYALSLGRTPIRWK